MKKSIIKMFVLALSLALILASCGSGGSKESGAKKISIMTAMAYGTEELDKVIKSFEENNPGIEVDIQHIPNDYEQTLASRINSGDIPDIFLQQTGSNVQKFKDYAYDFTSDPIVSKFKESAIEYSKDSEGKLISLPWTYESMGFIINKDVFEAAGITELPKTITELEEACKKIEAAGYVPFSVGLKETWVIAHIASHFVAAEDPDANVIVEKINKGELGFDTMSKFDNAFKMLDLMVKYGPEKPLEVNWELSENDLANAKTGIIHMGDWCESTLIKFNPNAKYGFMPVPISEDPADPTFLSSISWQFIVHKDSKNLEDSKKLLEYMLTSDQGIEWMTKGVKAIPSVKTDQSPDGILATDAQAYVDNGQSLPWNHTLWPTDYNNKLGAEMQKYIMGSATPEEIKQNLNNLWKQSA